LPLGDRASDPVDLGGDGCLAVLVALALPHPDDVSVLRLDQIIELHLVHLANTQASSGHQRQCEPMQLVIAGLEELVDLAIGQPHSFGVLALLELSQLHRFENR